TRSNHRVQEPALSIHPPLSHRPLEAPLSQPPATNDPEAVRHDTLDWDCPGTTTTSDHRP
ncbi:MAG: hypothetical protein KA110_11200, partial [Acidimicrobiia bacterium]|nr:hypothetical protein [Acidimicrobiia bacterium]